MVEELLGSCVMYSKDQQQNLMQQDLCMVDQSSIL